VIIQTDEADTLAAVARRPRQWQICKEKYWYLCVLPAAGLANVLAHSSE
jgi:hypothetical protein